MAKMRGIKPETFTDSKILRLSPLARWLFIGLWTEACDNGHVTADEIELKVRLLPVDNVDVSDLLTELETVGVIHREPGVITVCNLGKHQKIDRRYFKTCGVPACEKPETVESTPDTQRDHGEPTRAPDVHPPSPHDEGEGEGEGEKKKVAPLRHDVSDVLDYMDERLTNLGIRKPSRSKTNIDEMRRLIDIDGKAPEQIKRAIDFALDDSFWNQNIHSPKALRKAYDKLVMKAIAEADKQNPHVPAVPRYVDASELTDD